MSKLGIILGPSFLALVILYSAISIGTYAGHLQAVVENNNDHLISLEKRLDKQTEMLFAIQLQTRNVCLNKE